MKMPIEWHKQRLENMRKYLARNREAVDRINAENARIAADILNLESQIIRAEAMGKDGFDVDKFGVKK